MPATPAIQTIVTITAKGLNGAAVAMTFSQVLQLHFDYFKGMISLIDGSQGEFYFGLTTLTTVTYTIAGTTATITIS